MRERREPGPTATFPNNQHLRVLFSYSSPRKTSREAKGVETKIFSQKKKADCRAEAYFWGGGCESRYIHMC